MGSLVTRLERSSDATQPRSDLWRVQLGMIFEKTDHVAHIDKVSKVRDAVAQAFEDKTNRAAEAKPATGTQNTAARSVQGLGLFVELR